jgi:hypothetical protein
METSQKKAILFIDGDNIEAAYCSKLVNTAKENGYLAEIHLFANFTNIDGKGKSWDPIIDIYAIEAHHAPSLTEQKNSADIRLMIYLMSCLYEREDLDVFLIAANDNDYNPVVAEIRRFGKTAINLYTDKRRSERLLAVYNKSYYIEASSHSAAKPTEAKKLTVVNKPLSPVNKNNNANNANNKQVANAKNGGKNGRTNNRNAFKQAEQMPASTQQELAEKGEKAIEQAQHLEPQPTLQTTVEHTETAFPSSNDHIFEDLLEETNTVEENAVEGNENPVEHIETFAEQAEAFTKQPEAFTKQPESLPKQGDFSSEKAETFAKQNEAEPHNERDDRYDRLVKTVKTLIERGLESAETYSLSDLSEQLRRKIKKFSVKSSYKTRYSTFKKFLSSLMGDYPEVFSAYKIDMDVIIKK